MNKEELIFCPLGGSGEIGMNMNLYAYGKEDNQKWIVVDMGVTFADDSILKSMSAPPSLNTTSSFSSSSDNI